MDSERTPESIRAAARRFFANGEREAWEQSSEHAYTDDELRSRRERDNVERASTVSGAEAHRLLTTCAVLAVERDEARAELARLRAKAYKIAWSPPDHDDCERYHDELFGAACHHVRVEKLSARSTDLISRALGFSQMDWAHWCRGWRVLSRGEVERGIHQGRFQELCRALAADGAKLAPEQCSDELLRALLDGKGGE